MPLPQKPSPCTFIRSQMLRASALPLGSTPGSCLPDPSSACQQISCPSDQHTPAPAALAGPSDMDAGHSCLQWQAADSVDHPPSNNLAGVTCHHTHSLPPTPADSAWTDLAGPTAAAAGLADGRDVCDSDGWGAAALSGPALSSRVLGEQLVGGQVETRSQLDTSWFTAPVEVRPAGRNLVSYVSPACSVCVCVCLISNVGVSAAGSVPRQTATVPLEILLPRLKF